MKNNVIIASIYGRGYELAHQLKQQGCKALIWDLGGTPSLSSAEREGPFGVFVPHSLKDEHKKYLYGDHSYPVPQGFSVLNKDGPIELQGPLHSFLVETQKSYRLCYNFLSHVWANKQQKAGLKNTSQHLQHGFWNPKPGIKAEDMWLLCLTQEITNSHLKSYLNPQKKNAPSPLKFLNYLNKQNGQHKNISPLLFSPHEGEYIFRESSQKYFSDLLHLGKKIGVKYVSSSVHPPSDLEPHLTSLKSMMMGGGSHKVSLVWTLSGLETARYFPKQFPNLFPKWQQPVKMWLRFPLSWKFKEKAIPSLLVIAHDKGFWSQKPNTKQDKNKALSSSLELDFMVLKQNPSSQDMDLWVLSPYFVNPDKRILEDLLKLALDRLKTLFPGAHLKGFLPEKKSNEYFVLSKKPYLIKKVFFRGKGLTMPLFHLNPESAGKMDAYSLLLLAQKIAQAHL